MPFNIPRNVPSVSSTQREQDDLNWRSRNTNGHVNGHAKAGSITSKINEIWSAREDLPMYKDKPHYPSGRRKTMSPRTVGLLFIAFSVFFFKVVVFGGFSFGPGEGSASTSTSKSWLSSKQADWTARREAVKQAFITSWDGYEQYAWGMDEYHPVSKKGKNLARTNEQGIGWIIVDALDTAILMNLTTHVKHARDWMKTSLYFGTDIEVNTFETTIRMLGGLLSAHYLSNTFPHLAPQMDDDVAQPGEDLYLELATDLADRLLGAFETDSGVPLASVNLNTSAGVTSHADGGASTTAEAATLQLELKYLSKLTGEPLYWERAERVMQVIERNQRPEGLVPIHMYAATGQFRGTNIRLGSRGDSYYEYLIKQYLQTGSQEDVYLSMWDEALEGIKNHLVAYSKHSGLTVLGERQSGLIAPLTAKMDHLVCFLPGTIALGVTSGESVAAAKARLGSAWTKSHDENLRLAEELAKTCMATYKATKTGLAPEIAHFVLDEPPRMWKDYHQIQRFELELDEAQDAEWRMDVQIHDMDLHNLQRPETVESLFYLWKITGKDIYREWGWDMFESFMKHSAVEDDNGVVYGYTSLGNVNSIPASKRRRDNMEGFWLAETLKYFWLLFGGNDAELDGGLSLGKTVINTEAHFLPRFDMGRVFKTGWERTNPKFRGKVTAQVHEHEHEDGETHGMVEDNAIRAAAETKIQQMVDTKGVLDGIVPEDPDHDHEHEHGHVEDGNGEHVVEMERPKSDQAKTLEEQEVAKIEGGRQYDGTLPKAEAARGKKYGESSSDPRVRRKEDRFRRNFGG